MTDTEPVWAILFEDAERREPEVFTGDGAESAARARFAVASQSWTCHLLSSVDERLRADLDERVEADREIAELTVENVRLRSDLEAAEKRLADVTTRLRTLSDAMEKLSFLYAASDVVRMSVQRAISDAEGKDASQ